MVAALLPAASCWVPPPTINLGLGRSHFAKRALGHGVESCPGDLLKWVVERAINAGRDDLVEDVFQIDVQSRLVRVLLPEGHFYPVIAPNGAAVTLYCRAQVRNVRERRRLYLRKNGKRMRDVSIG